MDLRLGRWQDVLADVDEVDACITDPPYGERTHKGHDAGVDVLVSPSKRSGGEGRHGVQRREHEYDYWTPDDVAEFVEWTSRSCRGWVIAMTSHDLFPAWEHYLREAGRYVFAPVPAVVTGSRFRVLGDGPACWTVWCVVARPRTKEFGMGCVSNPKPVYIGKNERNMLRVGGKPLWLMRAIIRDYTKPGDLVCDPFAGGGTTLLAAAMEGRRAIGAEMDPETYAKAKARLAKGYTKPLFVDEPAKAKQGSLI